MAKIRITTKIAKLLRPLVPIIKVTHHIFDVVDVPPRYDGDVDIGHVGQPLQRVLGLQRQGGQVGVRRDRRQGPVVVEEEGQLLRVADVSEKEKDQIARSSRKSYARSILEGPHQKRCN